MDQYLTTVQLSKESIYGSSIKTSNMDLDVKVTESGGGLADKL